MLKVIFACATGMSVSMFMEFIKKEITKRELLILVESVPYSQIDFYIEEIDILIMAPQIAHLYPLYKKKYEKLGIKVYKLSPKDMGFMDPKPILDEILEGQEEC